jgi:hypothetical protein
MYGVGNDLAFQIPVFHQAPENTPVVRSGTDQRARRAGRQGIDELKCLTNSGRRIENARVRHYSKKAVYYKF